MSHEAVRLVSALMNALGVPCEVDIHQNALYEFPGLSTTSKEDGCHGRDYGNNTLYYGTAQIIGHTQRTNGIANVAI